MLKTHQIDLTSLLFGDILAVTSKDVIQTAIITAIILLLTKLFYKLVQQS